MNDEEARHAIEAASRLPARLGPLVVRYVGLFRSKGRVLAWPRASRLLGELTEMITAGRIEHSGRQWAAPEHSWHYALEATLQARDSGSLTTPLKDHGYLLKVIVSHTDRIEAGAEKKKQQQAQSRPDRGEGNTAGLVRTPGIARAALKEMQGNLSDPS